jgi:hypothetical protein
VWKKVVAGKVQHLITAPIRPPPRASHILAVTELDHMGSWHLCTRSHSYILTAPGGTIVEA